jgi:hypothetical protein
MKPINGKYLFFCKLWFRNFYWKRIPALLVIG